MSKEYLVVGDPHAKNNNLHIIEQLMLEVENFGLDCIWLGDMLDTKEVVRGKCLNAWIRYFNSSKLNHIILVGNHDFFNLDCKDHSLEALKHIPNVKIIDSPTKIDNMLFLPYIHEEEKLKDSLKLADKGDLLFGHLELKGFDFGNGHICESGLTARSFTKFKHVYSGHFHKFQTKKNLTYLGTPFSHSFGESDQNKFLGRVDTVSGNMELISTTFPQHKTIEIDLDEDPDLRPDISVQKDFYRVILKGAESNINAFPREEILTLNDEGFNVKIITRPTIESDTRVAISDTESNENQFSSWARDIKGLDTETVKLGLEILGEARAK